MNIKIDKEHKLGTIVFRDKKEMDSFVELLTDGHHIEFKV